MITTEDIIAAAIEGVADGVHEISAGGPGSGRHKLSELSDAKLDTPVRSVKHINKILEKLGYKERVGYKPGSGNVHYYDGKADAMYESSIGIARPSQMTVRQMLDDLDYKLTTDRNLHAASQEVSYPDDHKAAMRVPKGGSSCASCKYVSDDKKQCSNEYFIKYNGSKDLPVAADEYCSDWFEPAKEIEASTEQSFEDKQKGTLWNGILITGFTGPQEEGLRAMLSRIPPELLFNVKDIVAAPELQAKHGRFDDKTKTISFNPSNFNLRQRFGKGDGWISHPELTTVHEVGHSIYRSLTPEQHTQWENISGWMQGWKPGQSIAYKESRPGWGNATSDWTHKAGIGFTRHYAERNPDEDFADCFAFVLLGKGHQMEPSKKDFIDNYIKANVHAYPQVNIHSPIKANSFLYNILGGGPGSGRHPEDKEKPLSDRAQRALDSYVAQTRGKSQIARLNEVLVARYVKGDTTGDNRPFDVTTKKTGIEVKTIFPGAKNDKITQHPESLARKWKEQKTLKMKNVATVAIDMRGKGLDVYVKPSLGSFRLGSMQKISSIKDLGKYIQ